MSLSVDAVIPHRSSSSATCWHQRLHRIILPSNQEGGRPPSHETSADLLPPPALLPPTNPGFPSVLFQNCFELFIPDHKDQVIKACKTEADGRVVEGNHTFYRISAPTAEEKDEWINSIK